MSKRVIDPVLLPEKLIAAENGDRDAAKWLLQEYSLYVKDMESKNWLVIKRGTTPPFYNAIPPELLEYLANCFDYFLKNNNAWPIDKALGLNTGERGVKVVSEQSGRNAQICVEIIKLNKQQGLTLKEAKCHVATKEGLSFANLERKIWKSPFKEEAEVLLGVENKLKTGL